MWKNFFESPKIQLVNGHVRVETLVEELKMEYPIENLQETDIPHLEMHYFNAIHLPNNEKLRLAKEQLRMRGVKIPICGLTRQYVEKDFVPEKEDYIYIVYEDQVGYAYSNSSKLMLEILISRGIDEESVKKKDEDFWCYMNYIQRYVENYL